VDTRIGIEYFSGIFISRNYNSVNMEKRMARPYRMKRRAAARAETRERIVRATMALHDEQGVATTSFTDGAERAGVGPATVLRHFPTIGALVVAGGLADHKQPVVQLNGVDGLARERDVLGLLPRTSRNRSLRSRSGRCLRLRPSRCRSSKAMTAMPELLIASRS
jgi:hypothetical protein